MQVFAEFEREQIHDLFRAEKVAAHQEQFLRQRNHLHTKGANVRLFDDDAAAGFEHAIHFPGSMALVDHMVQRVHHNNPFEASIRERERFRVRAGKLHPGSVRLAQHPKGRVSDQHFPGIFTHGAGNPARSAACIQQTTGSRKVGLLQHRLKGRIINARIQGRDQTEMIKRHLIPPR